MNNLQIIREAVIKAVPEIMGSLIPGSFIKRAETWPVERIVTMHVSFKNNLFDVLLVRESQNLVFDLKEVSRAEVESWYIVGRPIRLPDVLIAMQKIHCDAAIMVDYNGQFWNCDDDMKIFKEVGEPWDISKDDLSLQSLPALEFLANLLK